MNRGQLVTLVVDEPIFIEDIPKEELKNLNTKVRDIIVRNFEAVQIIL